MASRQDVIVPGSASRESTAIRAPASLAAATGHRALPEDVFPLYLLASYCAKSWRCRGAVMGSPVSPSEIAGVFELVAIAVQMPSSVLPVSPRSLSLAYLSVIL